MANNNGSTTFIPKIIESLQTVVPSKPTEPRRSWKVTINGNLRPNIFRRWLHVVLYYKKLSQSDSGRFLAGWSKESLGKALLEQPCFAGRLQRVDGGDEKFQIVLNDSGVRLYEARMGMDLEECINLDDRDESNEACQLIYWEDIDEVNPQFCPLFYVQVSNFKCGGYSIGFSCSTILADPSTMTTFIKKWANIHKNIVSQSQIPKLPLFYNPIFCKTGHVPMNKNCFTHNSKNKGQTFIIKVTSKDMNLDQKEFAQLCINEVEQNLGMVKLPAAFCLYTKDRSGDEEIKVDKIMSKNGNVTERNSSALSAAKGASLGEYFGADEICPHGTNRPARVSSWINSVDGEGVVMVIPFPDEGKSGNRFIVVTI